ncbi:uncharacterized protein LOC135479604 [Liolophura sinensis]|uniref:uncharacterized protein LOC135479604 n=1 Tax=Liolophura sinensis TaxID=3198878 RepID=UPI0031594EC3
MNREEPADSGWLSTRNKRKITTPAASVKRKRSAVALCRPLGCGQPSAFYTLTQNSPPPPELFTRTHQTSIVSFFRAGSTKGNAEDAKAADVKSEGDEEPKKKSIQT